MTRTSLHRLAVAFFTFCVIVTLWPREVFASDDFNSIVHYIETQYHVHRNYPFLMGLAGMAARAWPGAGVKDVKIALFEDQQVLHTTSDRELDELIQAAGNSGWQPLVKSFSRRSGDHSYIYAKPEGRYLSLLIVNVEPSEAEVVQVKVDPNKLEEFINDHSGRTHNGHKHQSHEMEFD
jgi:hypothetical protein